MTLPFALCEQVIARLDKRVLHLQLNRPQQKNALSLAMYQSLANALQWAAQQTAQVRAVSLTGSEDSFTAGNDLADFLRAGLDSASALPKDSSVIQFMQALRQLPQPVVVGVNGLAIGIGTTLLLHCDFVYAADDAFFQMPFTRLGLCPEFASSLLLARRVGEARAREMLLLGEAFSAEQALSDGLINGVFPRERLMTEVENVCQKLALLPPEALRRSKALMNEVVGWSVDRVFERELEVFAECLCGAEAQAIIQQAIEEKR